MRHFTASTAIRQDGPLALSPLTGVVSVFCVHSCFRIKENLQQWINSGSPVPQTKRNSVSREMTTAKSRQEHCLSALFRQVNIALITVLPSLAASRAMSAYTASQRARLAELLLLAAQPAIFKFARTQTRVYIWLSQDACQCNRDSKMRFFVNMQWPGLY